MPVLVKIAPDLSDQAIGDLLEVCVDRGIAGVIATNTTLDRSGRRAGAKRPWRRRPAGCRAVRWPTAVAGGGAVRHRRIASCR